MLHCRHPRQLQISNSCMLRLIRRRSGWMRCARRRRSCAWHCTTAPTAPATSPLPCWPATTSLSPPTGSWPASLARLPRVPSTASAGTGAPAAAYLPATFPRCSLCKHFVILPFKVLEQPNGLDRRGEAYLSNTSWLEMASIHSFFRLPGSVEFK